MTAALGDVARTVNVSTSSVMSSAMKMILTHMMSSEDEVKERVSLKGS